MNSVVHPGGGINPGGQSQFSRSEVIKGSASEGCTCASRSLYDKTNGL